MDTNFRITLFYCSEYFLIILDPKIWIMTTLNKNLSDAIPLLSLNYALSICFKDSVYDSECPGGL